MENKYWIFFKFFENIFKCLQIDANKNVLVWRINRKIYLEKIKDHY